VCAQQAAPLSDIADSGQRDEQDIAAVSRYADVVVDVPTSHLGDTFTYAVPPTMDVRAGHLVTVPFGPRTVHGIVTQLPETTSAPYIKPILGLVLPEPVIEPWQLDLARWVSFYYMAPAFEAMSPMLPPGFRSRSQTTVRLVKGAAPKGELKPSDAKLLAYLHSKPGAVRLATAVRHLGGWVPRAVGSLVRQGLIEQHWEWAGPSIAPQFVDYLELQVDPAHAREVADQQMTRAPRRAALLRHLADQGSMPYLASDARRDYSAAVAALLNADLATLRRVQVERGPQTRSQRRAPEPAPLTLTTPQNEAIARITAVMDDPAAKPRTFVLQGVTGSGKTEVYLRVLAHCLAQGKRGIALVPELSLTPQTLERFEARFPDQVAALHSGLTPGQQYDQWWRVHRGDAPVVIGSRGAVFAPQKDVGLIVLDEEHEWTYKQHDASPRYHARDVAAKIAELTGAVVVLGSATPEVTSSYRARQGQHTLLTLPQRIESSGQPTELPTVQVVDMREELKSGNRSVFSRELQEGLKQCVSGGNQAILFLNRRGASSVVQCRSCGFVLRCWRCSTPYTYHGKEGHGQEGLVCHHCNHRRRAATRCPNCQSPHIRYLGVGTQRIAEEVEALLPGVSVLRWDRDTAAGGRAHAELLDSFASGDAQVLVGTQMIAKGLHVPSVTLVGAVLADIGLHVPDFRAAERSFQVLCQVAGRAGRGTEPGRVIVQTYLPDYYAIQSAAGQDYNAFYEREMTYRRVQGDPPLGRLIRLAFGHRDESATRREAQRLAKLLEREARQWGMNRVDVIGPAPAHPARLRGIWRWQILLRGADPRLLLDKVEVPPNWVVDVDPVSVV
jgi:primosomal protein N' (replication factor Y)